MQVCWSYQSDSGDPVVPLVHLVGGQGLPGRHPLSRKGDVAELRAEVAAEVHVHMAGPVCADGPGQGSVVLVDTGSGQPH